MEWNPWLYTPVLGMDLIQGAMCISGTKDLFVFNSDKWSGPQSLFIVTQALGLISNAFQAWKTFWWNGVKSYIYTYICMYVYIYVCVCMYICMCVWENVQYLSFFYLIYLTKHHTLQVHHSLCHKWQIFIFLWLSKILWGITSHLFKWQI